jgi:Ni,Fe-hydrogenase maturation factor
MKICVIDGQGGGIGATIIKKIKAQYNEHVEIIALGTNAIATAQMLKARANRGASGENAIIQTVALVDVIIGTISIVLAHSMMGEMTPLMTEAITLSPARKIIIPISQENIQIVGAPAIPLPQLVDHLINDYLSEIYQQNQ